MSDPEQTTSTPSDRAITMRSVSLGLLGVALICGITPFNNFVLNNTFLVGNLLPVGLLLVLSILILMCNAVAHRVAPRAALRTGELTIIFAMTLASCTLPSAGLMRWLPGHLVGLFNESALNTNTGKVLDSAKLADWIYPRFDNAEASRRGGESVVAEFFGRNADGHVPWSRWAKPALAWGVLAMLFYTAMAMLLIIVRRQWQENERLTFPLADVYVTLLEPPGPGRAWPPVFGSRMFWIAAGLVFVLHGLSGLAQWLPKIPTIAVSYNLNSLMSEPPLSYANYGLKAAKLVFTVVGISYFINLRVSFSIVFFYLMYNLAQIVLGPSGRQITEGMQRDQTLGAIAATAGVLVFVGRNHWMMVMRCMFKRRRPDDQTGDLFGSYAVAGWVLVASVVLAAAWFVAAGASVWMSAAIVLGVLSLWLVMARVAAESGLIYAQLHHAPLGRMLTIAAMDLPFPRPDNRSFLAASLAASTLATDYRENPAVYTSSAMVAARRATTSRLVGMMGLVMLALLVGFVVAGASSLWCEYNFLATLDAQQTSPLNRNGVADHPKGYVLGPLTEFASAAGGPMELHSRLSHVGIGTAISVAISAMYLRFAAFPLHPIGVVMAYSFSVQNSWLGIFAGWLLKSLITRFGGAAGYRAARPFFLGLIFGETGAVGFWLVVNAICAAMGIEYRAVNLMLP